MVERYLRRKTAGRVQAEARGAIPKSWQEIELRSAIDDLERIIPGVPAPIVKRFRKLADEIAKVIPKQHGNRYVGQFNITFFDLPKNEARNRAIAAAAMHRILQINEGLPAREQRPPAATVVEFIRKYAETSRPVKIEHVGTWHRKLKPGNYPGAEIYDQLVADKSTPVENLLRLLPLKH
jgi:hypothetical protein